MSALQPTPETDEAWAKWPYAGPGVHANFARKLERERDSAKTLNRTLLDQLEAQAALLEAVRHERDNTWEKLEAMREAIKEAEALLVAVDNGAQQDVGGVNWYDARNAALAKLKPLLP